MNRKHPETLTAHLTSSDSLIQDDEMLEQASILSPDSSHSIVGTNDYTLMLYPENDSSEWKLGDEEKTIWPADLLVEAPQYFAFDDTFLPNFTDFVPEDNDLGWDDANISPTIEQSFNYGSDEDDEDNWLKMTEFIDASLFDGDVSQDGSIRNPPSGQSERSSSKISTESEDIYKHATESINLDFSTLSDSTPSASPPEPEDHDTPNSIYSESQLSEIDSLPKFPREDTENEGTKKIEVIDLTADDLHASPEPPNPGPKDDSSNSRVTTQRIIFVDLTQNDDDDDDADDDDDEPWQT